MSATTSREITVARRSTFRPIKVAQVTALALAVAAGLGAGSGGPASASAATALPTPDHVVVVVFENHSYGEIIGSSSAPYINSLAYGGGNLTQSHAVTHPSQPNYLDLFSGASQGVTDDSCYTPGFSKADNLAAEVVAAGKTWASYNESLPSQGSTTCSSGNYARKHNPWFAFSNVPTSSAFTFAQFPTDFTTLPQVSFVTPNLCSDMHDCSVSTGDTWLKNNLGAYATWAKSHNSLLVVTTDEDDGSATNHIPTLFYGQPVTSGTTATTSYNHYDVLRTIEDMYGLGHAGNAATAKDITGIWAQPQSGSLPVLSQGQSGPAVTTLQYLLNQQGAALTADGDFGPLTGSAVTSFQSSRGLTADGIVNASTWNALFISLSQGASGAAVKALQTELNGHGAKLTVDGQFGPATRSAVVAFQSSRGLPADGTAAASTWGALLS
jgi:hypothetical protein